MNDWYLFLLRANDDDSYELEMMLSVMSNRELKTMYNFVKTQKKYKWALKYVKKEMDSRLLVNIA